MRSRCFMCVCFGWWASFYVTSMSIMTCKLSEPLISYVIVEVLVIGTMKSTVCCDVTDMT